MGFIKNIIIAFLISFCIILFITNSKLRKETFETLNHKIGKSKIKIFNIFVVFISFIIILYSAEILLQTLNMRNFIVERKVVNQDEKE